MIDDGRKPGAGLFVTGRAAAQSVRPTTRDILRGVQKDLLSASSGATPTAIIIIIPLVVGRRRVG